MSARNAPTNGETRNQPRANGKAMKMMLGIESDSPWLFCPMEAKTRKTMASPIASVMTRRLGDIGFRV